MANVKISDLTAYTTPVSTDVVPIVDLANDQAKKITLADMFSIFSIATTFLAGTEATPGIRFTADVDTGLYLAGNNKIGFATGGTGRVFIDSSGNVGIGVAVPTDALEVNGNVTATTFTGNLSGNSSTATILQTSRSIGGVSFNGSADINLPGVNQAGTQNTSGNAATATALQNARTIGGVSFDGSANINLPGVNTTGNQSTTGNAATATTLATARNINGTSFDGSADIVVGNVPQNSQTSAYLLVASDAGKHISITSGGVTVPSGTFSAGDAISIYNNSTANQIITQGTSVTLRKAGTATTGNRTLAQYGICTVLCVASNEFVITGVGVT